ncbi:MAG TPA: nickel-type superoxide dismutase maturation protease [Acidimicrobiales bacterium]
MIGAAGIVLLAAALVARCVRRVVVEGDSMTPTLLDGDRLVVLARPWGIPARAAVGDIVAVPDPRRPDRVLVKRVASVDWPDGTLVVLGDSPDASTDSRQFGAVPLASVVGRVVHRYGPPGRSGPVGRPTEYDRA